MAATLKEWHNSTLIISRRVKKRELACLPSLPVSCVFDSFYYFPSHALTRIFSFLFVCFFQIAETLCVMTSDGRILVGKLLGHDQVQNLILNDAHERVYSPDADVEEVPLGLLVIRGDDLCLVGEFDATKFAANQRAPNPIQPIQQQQF